MEEKKESKWQEEIEELLQYNRTIDEWIIHDYVWEQPSPSPHIDPELMQARQMLSRLIMMLSHYPAKPYPGSERERWAGIAGMLAGAGCPDEVINEFFRRLSQLRPPWEGHEPPEKKESG